jgi:predicted HicB family RNase H-like nuclease
METLQYKGYEGTAELDITRGVCRGKILFIHDVVTYESSSIPGLQKEFELAVDDYIETCGELHREPQRPLKGQFNVRVPPSMHRDAVLRATKDDGTLNDVVVKALGCYLYTKQEVHNVTVNLELPESEIKTFTASASSVASPTVFGVMKNVH